MSDKTIDENLTDPARIEHKFEDKPMELSMPNYTSIGRDKLIAEHKAMFENLTHVQKRCTELLEENRKYKQCAIELLGQSPCSPSCNHNPDSSNYCQADKVRKVFGLSS